MSARPDEAHREPTQVIREIVLRAAAGRQHEALGELLDLTGSEDPPIAWMAAAAALPGMYWEGATSEASDWFALAESLLRAGRPSDAEQIVLGARAVWYPLAVWDTLPITPVLHPALRQLITGAVRTAYFTLPVGEMVPR